MGVGCRIASYTSMLREFMVEKSDLVTVADIPVGCADWMGLEFKPVLCEFGQCCHHRRVLSCCVIHKNSTAEGRGQVRIEHGVFV